MPFTTIVSTPKSRESVYRQICTPKQLFKHRVSARFKEVIVDHMMDMDYLADYEEVVGNELSIEEGMVEHDDSMVMELLWLFNHSLRTTDKSAVRYFQEEVNHRKEYGIICVMEHYIPESRTDALWKYYYRKALERDINNRLRFL